jgi:phosphoglucosamine mutase
MKKKGQSLSELTSCMTPLPQVLVNVKVRETRDLATIPQYAQCLSEVEKRLQGTGRILVRYSGTEPTVRIMIEGENREEITRMAQELAEPIRECIGLTSQSPPGGNSSGRAQVSRNEVSSQSS